MNARPFLLLFSLLPLNLDAQALAPAELLKPLSASWPTYSGDYSGRRYSQLSQINQIASFNEQ